MTESLELLAGEMVPATEREMRVVLKAEDANEDAFLGMMHYHMGWVDASFNPVDGNSGKRIRPLLCLLSCESAGGDWRRAIPAAASIELLHNFTLIHDDIQDSSPTRRGQATLWQIWGVNQAINSGDAMFALSHIAMSRLLSYDVPAESVVRALRRLDDTCLELTIGQFADMSFEDRVDVQVNEYLAMTEGKTAALLSFATEVGSVVAKQESSTIQHYAAFGRDLGLAFQVRDDILGIWGNEKLIGKSSSTDIAGRKKSLPILFGLSKSEELSELYFNPNPNINFVAQVIKLLDEVDARSFAEAHEMEYATSALAHLEAAGPSGSAADALRELTAKLLGRQT